MERFLKKVLTIPPISFSISSMDFLKLDLVFPSFISWAFFSSKGWIAEFSIQPLKLYQSWGKCQWARCGTLTDCECRRSTRTWNQLSFAAFSSRRSAQQSENQDRIELEVLIRLIESLCCTYFSRPGWKSLHFGPTIRKWKKGEKSMNFRTFWAVQMKTIRGCLRLNRLKFIFVKKLAFKNPFGRVSCSIQAWTWLLHVDW